MNPARSPQTTGCRPARCVTSTAVASVTGEVDTVRTTSTRRMTGAGLKKCSPTTSCGRDVTAASSITGRLEVVVARTAPGLQISSRFSKSAVLTLISSTTASTTRSAWASASREEAPVTRARIASRSAASSLPRCTAFSSDLSRVARARARLDSERATSVTSKPPLASTSAMPVAMVPEPTTPTLCTGSGSMLESMVAAAPSSTISGELGPA